MSPIGAVAMRVDLLAGTFYAPARMPPRAPTILVFDSGLGGLSSIIGLMLQIGLIIIVVRLAMSWWQRRHTPASAYAGAPAAGPAAPQTGFGSGMGFGLGSGSAPLEILPADYEAFERLLAVVRRTAGEDRDMARKHLVELFGIVGDDDPRVGTARRALTSALF